MKKIIFILVTSLLLSACSHKTDPIYEKYPYDENESRYNSVEIFQCVEIVDIHGDTVLLMLGKYSCIRRK